MKIIGAGIAGLLAANMLRHKNPIVYEQQDSLPNNHSAVLRFRSHVIGDVTGIEFKKVTVIKASLPWKNAIADALAYAEKNTGTSRSDRSLPSNNLEPVERFIAPTNLISRLAETADIRYSIKNSFNDIRPDKEPIISTIPMPSLMIALNYGPNISTTPAFTAVSGTNLIATVANCDAYASLYTPSPFYPFSRISLTGNELVAEVPTEAIDDPEIIYAAASLIGIERDRLTDVRIKKQQYAKILPIDDGLRKRFIAWATDTHGIYSLGRFACWRPQTLLDDLVQDIRLIERWMSKGQYARKLHDNRREA